MRAVVRDLATFARPQEEQPRPVDLGAILVSCLNVAWPEIRRRGARLVRDLEPIAPVLADPGRISQVFLNLILNAAQAIPDGQGGEHEIRVVCRNVADDRVSIEVQDTGAGIPAEHLPRIFDPFFTTKAPGLGTGLGLSICHAVVTAMGGTIEVDTAVGMGSRFRVVLPGLATEAARRAGTPTQPPAPRRAQVLVVDDEPLVGTMLRRTLAAHDVTIVHDARAALERITAGDRYDVILADLLMPEMSGMELYETATSLNPALARRFVFLTGGAFTADVREFLDGHGVEWFEKPFDVPALRAAVARRVAPAPSASA
jgi:CheY-like chemotaxis protein